MSAGKLPTCIRHLIIFIHIRGNWRGAISHHDGIVSGILEQKVFPFLPFIFYILLDTSDQSEIDCEKFVFSTIPMFRLHLYVKQTQMLLNSLKNVERYIYEFYIYLYFLLYALFWSFIQKMTSSVGHWKLHFL